MKRAFVAMFVLTFAAIGCESESPEEYVFFENDSGLPDTDSTDTGENDTESEDDSDTNEDDTDTGTENDGGTDSDSDSDSSTDNDTLPDPVLSDSEGSQCTLLFAKDYVDNGICAIITNGAFTSAALEMMVIAPIGYDYFWHNFDAEDIYPGTYDLTYKGVAASPLCALSEDVWADYGDGSKLVQMTEIGLSWIYCTWWDETTGETIEVDDPYCTIRTEVNTNGSICNFAPAGNMANYND